MKTISKFLFFAFLLFFNSAFADLASDAEKLFSWGEQKYPSYFSIGETEVVTKILNYKGHDWYYRYYPETKVFLAINELNKVYVLGGVFGRNLLYIGRLEDLLDVPSLAKPSLTTTPTRTQDDTVEVEVNGEIGATVFVNDVDSGKTIDSNGKVRIILDTSGDDGEKNFSVTLKDDKGNESEALSFTITKKSTLNEGLVAYYEFEGNAKDSSGNGNNGTEHGGVSYVDGVIGKAGSFDGVDDWIDVKVSSLPINNNSRTISAWVSMKNGTDTDIDQLIVHYGGNTANSGFGLQYGLGNSYVFGIWNLGCTYDVTIDNKNCTESNLGYPNYVKQNKNYHLVALYDGTNEKVFINGILQGNKEQSLNTNLSNLYIGAKNSSFLFNGIIDDLRIYNRALNKAEIQELYKMGQQ